MTPTSASKTPLCTELDNLDEAWAAGDRRAVYEAARSAWRARPVPALASLVERAAAVLSSPLAKSRSSSSWKSRWIERARAAEPHEIATLLRSVLVQPLSRAQLRSCLVELTIVKRDPATGRAALELSQAFAARGQSWTGVIGTALMAWMEASADAGLVPGLEALMLGFEASDAHGAKIRGRLERVRASLAGQPSAELAEDEAERIEQIVARFDTPLPRSKKKSAEAPIGDVEALERAVQDDPDDDALRAVWADALQRAEDPRGELAALQLAGLGDARVRRAAEKLVAKHWRSWLGPLASVVVPASVAFDRGLFDACTTKALRKSQVSIFSHPAWGTVRRITFGGAGALTPAMRRLTEVRGLPSGALSRLDRLAFPALQWLEVNLQSWPIAALERASGLPALRSLILHPISPNALAHYAPNDDGLAIPVLASCADYESLLRAPFVARLEQLGLPLDWLDGSSWTPAELAGLLASLRGSAPNLRALDLEAARQTGPNLQLRVDLARGTISLGPMARYPGEQALAERARSIAASLKLTFESPA